MPNRRIRAGNDRCPTDGRFAPVGDDGSARVDKRRLELSLHNLKIPLAISGDIA